MKTWNYVFIMVLIAILFTMAGIPIDAGSLSLLGISTNNVTLNNTFYITILAVLAAAAATGIGIGFITKSNSENLIIAPVIAVQAVIFVAILIGILSYSFANYPGWISAIVLLIMGPLTIGFVFGLLEFFRGTD